MEDVFAVLDAHAGLLRALTETLTAITSTLTAEQAAMAHDRLSITRQLGLELDETQPPAAASIITREAALKAFCELLEQRSRVAGEGPHV